MKLKRLHIHSLLPNLRFTPNKSWSFFFGKQLATCLIIDWKHLHHFFCRPACSRLVTLKQQQKTGWKAKQQKNP